MTLSIKPPLDSMAVQARERKRFRSSKTLLGSLTGRQSSETAYVGEQHRDFFKLAVESRKILQYVVAHLGADELSKDFARVFGAGKASDHIVKSVS